MFFSLQGKKRVRARKSASKKEQRKKRLPLSPPLSLAKRKSVPLTPGRDDDGDDQAVNTEHAGHDDGDDRLHHELGAHHSHRGNTDAGLGRAVGGSEACFFFYGAVWFRCSILCLRKGEGEGLEERET